MKIYVDIDGTICNTTHDKGQWNYKECTPMQERISYINKLYDQGHTIVYWTARGSSTPDDKGRILWLKKLTEAHLEEWGAKYHILSVAEKPDYDLYIDDKSINCNSFFMAIDKTTNL